MLFAPDFSWSDNKPLCAVLRIEQNKIEGRWGKCFLMRRIQTKPKLDDSRLFY